MMLEKIQKAIGCLQALSSHPLQSNDATLVKVALDNLDDVAVQVDQLRKQLEEKQAEVGTLERTLYDHQKELQGITEQMHHYRNLVRNHGIELLDWRQWAKGLVSVLPTSDDYLRQKIGSGFHGFEEWNRWAQKELEGLHLQFVWPLLREAGCDVRGIAERARVAISKELRDLSDRASNLSGMIAKVRGIVG